ncbi:hypothetical protein H1R20_g15780, partial [Candolleomyces eurysporus]
MSDSQSPENRPIWTREQRNAFSKWQKESRDLVLFCKDYGGVFRIKCNFYTPGLTERQYRVAVAHTEEIPGDEEGWDSDSDASNGSDEGSQGDAVQDGEGAAGPPEDYLEDLDVSEHGHSPEDYDNFVIPILEGWIGDYRGTPTMRQRQAVWRPRIFEFHDNPFL